MVVFTVDLSRITLSISLFGIQRGSNWVRHYLGKRGSRVTYQLYYTSNYIYFPLVATFWVTRWEGIDLSLFIERSLNMRYIKGWYLAWSRYRPTAPDRNKSINTNWYHRSVSGANTPHPRPTLVPVRATISVVVTPTLTPTCGLIASWRKRTFELNNGSRNNSNNSNNNSDTRPGFY